MGGSTTNLGLGHRPFLYLRDVLLGIEVAGAAAAAAAVHVTHFIFLPFRCLLLAASIGIEWDSSLQWCW